MDLFLFRHNISIIYSIFVNRDQHDHDIGPISKYLILQMHILFAFLINISKTTSIKSPFEFL